MPHPPVRDQVEGEPTDTIRPVIELTDQHKSSEWTEPSFDGDAAPHVSETNVCGRRNC